MVYMEINTRYVVYKIDREIVVCLV